MLGQQILNGITLGANYALIALGLTMIFGILGILNLAHGQMYMLGAFVCYFLVKLYQVDFFISMAISMMAVGCLGVITEKTVIRPLRGQPDENFLILTVGLIMVIENLALFFWGTNPRSLDLQYAKVSYEAFGIVITLQRIIVLGVVVVLFSALYWFIKKTKWGKAIRAVAQEKEGAAAVGISVDRISAMTFGIGSALAAAAGSLTGSIYVVYPSMGFMPLLKSLVVVIFGGLGSAVGAIIAGVILGLAETLGQVYISSEYKDAIAFAILIVILSFRPSGLFGRR
jgi:branched-chain amino acid transport system permease protein